MASPTADLSHGITIVFGTSGFTAEITDVTPPGAERGKVDTSHQGTTNFKTFSPEDLVEWGAAEFEINFNPDTDPPVEAVPETVTITFPAGTTWAFTGWMSSYKPQAPHLDLMVATVGLEITGDIVIANVS